MNDATILLPSLAPGATLLYLDLPPCFMSHSSVLPDRHTGLALGQELLWLKPSFHMYLHTGGASETCSSLLPSLCQATQFP